MKIPIYLLATVMFLAAACGDSDNDGAELLFVQTSGGAVLSDSELLLVNTNPETSWFTDRPYREAGQVSTEEFVALWDLDSENFIGPSTTRGPFADDPPNSDFTCTVDGEVVNYTVELQDASLVPPYCEAPQCFVRYDVTFIGPNVVEPFSDFECDGPAHLFIGSTSVTIGADGKVEG
ncbi:MAG: hypothetical protein P8K76_09155 [Candidatus Binatia bacterium]|nr:hypothetical protein [Candidatus Binatia bacterium]MDG2009933.1 hypothetical protein [Candidatus Binatia bacterium]